MPDRITLLAGAALAVMFFQHDSAAAAGVSPAQARVIRRIAAKQDWLAATRLCPTEVMPRPASVVDSGNDDCKALYDNCLSKCESGNAGSCYWLAYQLQQNEAPTETYEALYQRACKLGVVSGCTNHAAWLSRANPDDAANQKCVAKTFELGCERDDPWACTMYAYHLSRGIGVAKDEASALKMLDKSCKYGDSDAACGYAKGLRKMILDKQPKKRTPEERKY